MLYRKLGTSDLDVPVVSFGAWAIGGSMWGGTDDDLAVRALHKAIDVGITLIDTAPAYGNGYSETIIAKVLADRRDEVIVATKCGVFYEPDMTREGNIVVAPDGREYKLWRTLQTDKIRPEIEQSLSRLGIDTIDLYQCHWPDADTPAEETMAHLLDLQAQGKIRHIGVSNFTPADMDEFRKHGVIVSDQVPYNPLQRENEETVTPYTLEHGLGVMAYSPIAQGLMTGKVPPERTFVEGDWRVKKPWFSVENRARIMTMLEEVQPIADRHGATLGQVAINWVFSQPGITTAIVGARNDAQVVENAGSTDFELSEDELATIRGLVEGLGDPE